MANGGFANRVTITELLKKNGYSTGHFGKWHIGPVTKPRTYGIDEIRGTEEGGSKKKKADEERGCDAHIYDDAIRFIDLHKNMPYYINVWGHLQNNKTLKITMDQKWRLDKMSKLYPAIYIQTISEKTQAELPTRDSRD